MHPAPPIAHERTAAGMPRANSCPASSAPGAVHGCGHHGAAPCAADPAPGRPPPRRAGGKPRSVNLLDRFDIDYALCMYCGICVEVCPFDALFWSPEYEYSEPHIADLLHDKDKLGEWMETVPEAPELEAGAEKKK